MRALGQANPKAAVITAIASRLRKATATATATIHNICASVRKVTVAVNAGTGQGVTAILAGMPAHAPQTVEISLVTVRAAGRGKLAIKALAAMTCHASMVAHAQRTGANTTAAARVAGVVIKIVITGQDATTARAVTMAHASQLVVALSAHVRVAGRGKHAIKALAATTIPAAVIGPAGNIMILPGFAYP